MSVNNKNNVVNLGGDAGFDVLQVQQPVPTLTGNTINLGTIYKAIDGIAYAVDALGDGLKLANTSGALLPALVPVKDFKTQADIDLLASSVPQPNNGTSYIVTDGSNQSNIATWDTATKAWIYYVPINNNITTVTNPDIEDNLGGWKYDSATDTWIQESTTIPTPDPVDRAVSSLNIVFGRTNSLMVNTLYSGQMRPFIVNDMVCIWGNNFNFTTGASANSEANQVRKLSWNWYDGANPYAPAYRYAPKFTDVTSNNSTALAIDTKGKIWAVGNRVEGTGLTTTPTGTTAIGAAPSTGLTPVGFWQANANLFAAKVFINDGRNAPGNNVSAVLTTDNEVYMAGNNTYGTLGQGNTTTYANWVKLSLTNVIDIKLLEYTALFLTATGDLYLTGYIDIIGGATTRSTPVLLLSGVANFDYHIDAYVNNIRNIVAVKNDGTVWGVGANSSGLLGLGSTTAVTTFQKALGVKNAKSVFCSRYAGYGPTGIIRTDNTVSFAGYNDNGAMGYAPNTSAVANPTFVTPTFAGQGKIIEGMIGRNTVLRTSDGDIWVAGDSNFTGLGHNNSIWANNNVFQKVPLPEPAIAMRGGIGEAGVGYNQNTWVLTDKHGMFAWGGSYPTFNQVGNTAQYHYSPTEVVELNYANTGETPLDPLANNFEKPGVISGLTAGSITDIQDGENNQFVTVTLTVDGTKGFFDVSGATLTGASITASNTSTRVFLSSTTGNTISLIFRLNAADILPSPSPAAVQNYTITLAGQSLAISGNRLADPPVIGRLLQGATILQDWTTNNQTFGTGASSPVTIGAYRGYNINYSGTPGGTNGITVAGRNTALGDFNGGGTVTFTTTQIVNQSMIVQDGATANIGIPGSYATVVGMQGTVVVQNGGVVNWQSRDANQMFLTVNSGGVFNIIGNAPLNTGDSYQMQTTVVNGILNISNAQVQMFSGFGMSGSGIVNVNAGATFFATPGSPTGVTFRIAGNGTGVAGNQAAAVQWANNLTVGNNIVVADDATIGAWNPWTYTGQLTIPTGKTLTIGNGGGADTGYNLSAAQTPANITGTIAAGARSFLFFNVANYAPLASLYFPNVGVVQQEARIATNQTFVSASFQTGTSGYINLAPGSVTITNQDSTKLFPITAGSGSVSLTGGTLNTVAAHQLTGTFTISAGAGIGGGTATTGSVRALTFSGTTSRLVVNPITTSTASRLGCTVFTASSGFTVDITGPLDAGTYTILTRTSGANTIPTIGVNNSGRTASFTWSGNNLVMTLS
jgi:alpha-tubulin suppressor-like RCC1 family protein